MYTVETRDGFSREDWLLAIATFLLEKQKMHKENEKDSGLNIGKPGSKQP